MNIKKIALAVTSLAVLAMSNYIVAGSTDEKEQPKKDLRTLEEMIREQEKSERIERIVISAVGLSLAGGAGYYLLQGLPAEHRNTILTRAGIVIGAYISIVHILPTFILLNARGGL